MFCQSCGTQNPEGSLFCQECGVKLDVPNVSKAQEAQVVQTDYVQLQNGYIQPLSTSAVPAKPMSKKSKMLIGLIVLLCVAIFGFYNFAKTQFNPGKVAEKYFTNVMNAKWENVYNSFDIKESKFITKKNFLKSQKSTKEVKYNTYKVGKAIYDKDSLGTIVVITYRLKGDSEDSEFEVSLNKQKEKNLLFFDSWKINPSSYIKKNFEIQVPKEAEINFDGTKLGDKFISNSDETYTYINIPELFFGEYPITVKQEHMETIKTKVSASDSGYYVDEMNLSKQTQSDIIKAAQNVLQSLYTAGLAKQDFSTVADNFSNDQTIRDNAQTQYTDFMNSLMSENGAGITQIDFSDFTGDTDLSMDAGVVTVQVEISYNYNLKYKALDWWSGELKDETKSNTNSDSFTYIFENGKWVIKSADYDVIYY